jgi:hypothetical protein
MDYTKDMEKLIRKNALKYGGLNVKAAEFVPEKRKTNFLVEYLQGEEFVGSEKDFFDKLESEFVENNSWLFE